MAKKKAKRVSRPAKRCAGMPVPSGLASNGTVAEMLHIKADGLASAFAEIEKRLAALNDKTAAYPPPTTAGTREDGPSPEGILNNLATKLDHLSSTAGNVAARIEALEGQI